jgi:hypothetical protein
MAVMDLATNYPTTTQLENGTVMNYRNENRSTGPDHGMLDIIKINHSLPEINHINMQEVHSLLEETSMQQIYPTTINAYINKGVNGTRTYHIDNTQPVTYKAFLYLTDVESTAYGPYSFIRRSQKLSFYTCLFIPARRK